MCSTNVRKHAITETKEIMFSFCNIYYIFFYIMKNVKIAREMAIFGKEIVNFATQMEIFGTINIISQKMGK